MSAKVWTYTGQFKVGLMGRSDIFWQQWTLYQVLKIDVNNSRQFILHTMLQYESHTWNVMNIEITVLHGIDFTIVLNRFAFQTAIQ